MDIDEKKLFTLPAQKAEGKKASPGMIREKRLVHYLVGEYETKLGDRLLALPRYTLPLARFQYFIGPVRPSLYYVSLAGSVVGLSADPSFVAREENLVVKEGEMAVAREENMTVAREENMTVAREEKMAVAKEGEMTAAREEKMAVAREGEMTVTAVDTSTPFPDAPYIPPLMNKLPICLNVGVGVVYSIDLKRSLVTLITPLGKEEMESVNTIIIGKQALPQALMENVGLLRVAHK